MSATLLCIDDQEQGLEIRKLLLQSLGYLVITASSGQEGLGLLRANNVDVVILDYRMDGMDGEAVAEEIRREKPRLPIIILSGFPTGIPARLSQMADAVLVKGRPVMELLAAIGKALGQAPPRMASSRANLLEASKLAVERSEKVLAEIAETRAPKRPAEQSGDEPRKQKRAR